LLKTIETYIIRGKKTMKKTILIITICLLLVASWSLLFVFNRKSKTVSIHEVEYQNLKNTVELTGRVVSQNIHTISSKSGGEVKAVFFRQGDRINNENTIISLNNETLKNELEKAKLELRTIKNAVPDSIIPASSNGNNSGIISFEQGLFITLAQTTGIGLNALNNVFLKEQPIDTIETLANVSNYNPPTNQMEILELSVNALEKSIADLSIKSPISGEIISINCTQGQYLSPYFPAIVVADTNDLIIEAMAFENDVNRLDVNTIANILTNDSTQQGYISTIGNLTSANAENQIADVIARIEIIPEKPLDLKLGATTDLEIVLDSRQNVVAVPVDAIVEKTYIFVVKNNIANRKKITTGFTDGYFIEVLSGISHGDKIIVSPDDIEDKDKVKVQ